MTVDAELLAERTASTLAHLERVAAHLPAFLAALRDAAAGSR